MINLFKKPYKKKAGKFQPFKKLFGRRKKREPVSACEESKLKPSHSFGNICTSSSSSSDEEPSGGLRSSHYSMGSRAFSHDSIFIPDGRAESDQAIQAMSQENVLGKVKTLQQQLAKNIKFGQPPQMTVSVRAMEEEATASMEEDVLLSAPMEMETQQDTVISDSGNKFPDPAELVRTLNFPGAGRGMEEKVPPIKSSRPKRQFSCSGTIETINLDAVPQAVARLDNSAAKHKLAVKPKKQRVSRKHKRLTKGSQSLTITEFEPEDLEAELYGDRYPGYNGHIIADKLIQNRSEQKQLQLAEERGAEDHWGILEAERIRQIVEMEEQRDMEEQRCQELEQMHRQQERRRCGEERQCVLEGEATLNIGDQASHKEERRLLEDEEGQELEEQRYQELEKQRHELEEQKHQEWEERQRPELKKQKHQEQEEKKRPELEEQKHQEQEEQQRRELQKQKHHGKEEQKRRKLEKQKHQEQEEQQRQELEEQKLQEQEEHKRQELEEQKLQEQEEHKRQELEEQKLQEQKEHKRQELEEQKLQEQEHKRQELEEQKLQEQEHKRQELEEQKLQEQEHKRQELEEQKLQEQEQKRQELEEQKLQEQRHQELEEQRHQEREEQRCKELKEKQREELEEQERLELEEQRQREAEKQCQEEGEGKWHKEHKELKEQNEEGKQRQELEEKELQGAEIKLRHEKEAEGLKQQKKEEEQRQHWKEKEEKTEKGQPQQGVDRRKKREEHKKHKLTKQMHLESAESVLQEEPVPQEQQNKRDGNKLEEQKLNTEGQNPHQNQQEKSLEEPQDKDQLYSGGADRHPEEEKVQEAAKSQKVKAERGEKTAEEVLAQKLKKEEEAQEQKRIGEELRWQEVDERQTASRPFTFQVSSGDKEIIFQKVNLSPVMPVKGAGLPSAPGKECRLQAAGQGPPRLPAAGCVPHTAILVTGAQLCGTAVNLHQIKDSACKSLLGLTEERRNVEIPSPEKGRRKPQDPKPGSSSKVRYGQEAAESQAVLAEWASIRSRILKNAESSRYGERERGGGCRHSDDWTPRGRGAPHGSLRKTLSANAKFSITPAWQKFSEASRASPGAESVGGAKGSAAGAGARVPGSSAGSKEEVAPAGKENLAGKAKEKAEAHGDTADSTEGCKFAKDLPSFLVPSFPPPSPGKELSQVELPSAVESQQSSSTKKADKAAAAAAAANGEENVSPFGIKLRRTNYSLRFHYDQQAEQRKKKRYSAGDSFDGVPDPLVTTDGEKEASVFAAEENTSPGTGRGSVPAHPKDSSVAAVEASQPPATPPASAQSAVPLHEKPASKSLATQKPALAPKPSSQTPPASPLAKLNRSSPADVPGPRLVKAEAESGWRKEDRAHPGHPTPANEGKNEEEEVREKKSFFPSLSIPWREKNDKKPEPPKKEKPVLQSRHSLDGSKLMEKVEASQPLWITLALQKQKGFREQQATREERRQAREAKQAERLAKEIAAASNQSDNKSSSSSSSKPSTLQKSTTQEGEKKTETAVTRLERREQLKKSNTLPTSVTVEISDSVPSTPLAKEVAKRFSTPDANPVSTEPAWLALAKRKAKAWSDCPQIIK
ncbi:capping protein-inhibiting regulator of actin dynamics [Dryobates pubescens]|uniref:capping protein-inhibiting regulator of actin dynamics n=1 Tax=Dryobates pubescens TaxID=118200 RepID=UPI0023B977B6|nr:capping protein-inhibiting regulator of actin dynamics [Dryobates pubescens]XP_054019119.1 capping protein-inhibiting regulator of actin dynamics [Dryobates pubescens]XP_054019130.1 capping protein-inhibiting regulator of actin dynamics [Dryobates pubescens]